MTFSMPRRLKLRPILDANARPRLKSRRRPHHTNLEGRPSGRSAISNAELQKRYAALPLKERRSFTRAATAIRAALPVNVRRMTGFGVSSLRQRLSRLTINPRK